MGNDRFGILSLVWMLVGYFTILDMGIGRALTKIAAERIGQRREEDLPALFWTSCLIMLVIGSIAGLVVGAISPWLTTSALKIPLEMQHETLRSFQVVALSLPVVVMTAGMIGMLEARQKFLLINIVRVPMGSFTFIGPLLVLPFSKSLLPVVLILLAGRVVEWFIYFVLCLYEVPALRHGFKWARHEVMPLLSTGIWINISMLIMPFMVHIDRFLIGSILTVGLVTYYATPSEIVVKLLIFPRALVSVLFPTFAAHFEQRTGETAGLLARSMDYLIAILLPVILLVIAFTPEFLGLWLGGDFAVKSTSVMRWLTTGMFIYCLTWIPFTFLQGIGQPKIPAIIQVIEFLLYVALAVPMIRHLGIEGVAIAWLIRAAFELVIMLGFSRRYAPVISGYFGKWVVSCLTGLAMIAAVVSCEPILLRGLVTIAGLLVWAALAWFYLFNENDRRELLQLVR